MPRLWSVPRMHNSPEADKFKSTSCSFSWWRLKGASQDVCLLINALGCACCWEPEPNKHKLVIALECWQICMSWVQFKLIKVSKMLSESECSRAQVQNSPQTSIVKRNIKSTRAHLAVSINHAITATSESHTSWNLSQLLCGTLRHFHSTSSVIIIQSSSCSDPITREFQFRAGIRRSSSKSLALLPKLLVYVSRELADCDNFQLLLREFSWAWRGEKSSGFMFQRRRRRRRIK